MSLQIRTDSAKLNHVSAANVSTASSRGGRFLNTNAAKAILRAHEANQTAPRYTASSTTSSLNQTNSMASASLS